MNTFRAGSVNYVSSDLIETWVQEITKTSETALQIAIKSHGNKTKEYQQQGNVKFLLLASWLIDHGCVTDRVGENGVDVIDLSKQLGMVNIADVLFRHLHRPLLRAPMKIRGYSYFSMSIDLMNDVENK